ncbi:D-cysteine desulfhydrase family protein [Pyruvatibacter sp.]|uniref:D-cysteine desulfhydrase family protein n=1 Tax=Pyruvatibacter sp. TaxID=1981328 RepID=UPI0032EC53CD
MTDHFDSIARVDLVGSPTPLQEMPRLRAALETTRAPCPHLLVKREDLGATAGGGNKIRKLEYLLADAQAKGADTVVTAGALQSNHVRQTAGSAAKLGMGCVGVLFETVPNQTPAYMRSGNILLDGLFGADLRVFPATANGREVLDSILTELTQAGRTPYVVPVGGSNALGCLGYVRAAREMQQQASDAGTRIDHMVVANGSAGTHAGLVAGTQLFLSDTSVHGIGVLNPDADKVRETVSALATDTMRLATDAAQAHVSTDQITLHNGFLGEGYGQTTPEMAAAVRLVARTEGLLLDPVYSGKAMAGLLGLIQSGAFTRNETVVFIATGGSPGLFAYVDAFTDQYAE